MTKAELMILKKAFAQEIDGALSHHSGIYQTRSKIAARLADEGYLERIEEKIAVPPLGHVTCRGYRLTHAGRLAYCASC